MASRYYSASAQDTTVTSGITSSSTTVTVGATTGYPSNFPFVLALDYNTAAEELVTVTGVSGLTLTITRGYNGTSATAHASGAVVRHVITAQDLTDAQTHYDLALSSGAHGVTGALATFIGTPSSANLKSLITDETGTGSLVFANGPTLTNADLTSATNSFPSSLGNTFTVNAQTGTTYTLVASDANKLVTATNASPITVTIPAGVFSVGQSVNVVQLGAGQVTFQNDGTSTVYSTPGVKLRAQYSIATVACIATNTFLLVGDLTA
jgi:hypothetical protein